MNATAAFWRMAVLSMNPSFPSIPGRMSSRPRNMFSAESRCGARARSWWTTSMPTSEASCGVVKWIGAPLEEDLALVDVQVAGQGLDEGRLAGPVVADESDDLPGAHVELGVVEGLDPPEAAAEVVCLEERAHATASW